MARVASLLFVAILTACDASGSPSSGAPPTSLPAAVPTSTSIATPTTTPTTTTASTATTDATITAPPSSDPGTVDDDVPMLPDDAACDVEWDVPVTRAGHVTIARDRNLFDVDVETGAVACIARLDRMPTSLDWNPAGDRLLVDGQLILSVAGRTTSGFAPEQTGISWSAPLGTALIAPSPDGDSLVHVSADDPTDVSDVGALATTWAAAYHPSGLAIVSAGMDDDGRPGLFIADNQGGGVQRLVFLEDAETVISDVSVAADGGAVIFVHDHTGGTIDEGARAHVHRLRLPELWIEDIGVLADAVPTNLVTSRQLDGAVAWSEPGSSSGGRAAVWHNDGSDLSLDIESADTVSRVAGFVDGGTVVSVVSPVDSGSDGEVWLTTPSGERTLVARHASAATVRVVHVDNWLDPPLDIELQAVG